MDGSPHPQPPAAEPAHRAGPLTWRLAGAGEPTADLEPAVALIGFAAAAAIHLLPLERLAPFAGECTFHSLTGWPCVTCGTTRAVLALSHGQLPLALRMNPLAASILLGLLLYAPPAALMWIGRVPRPRLGFATRRARLAGWAVAGLAVLATWAFLIADGR